VRLRDPCDAICILSVVWSGEIFIVRFRQLQVSPIDRRKMVVKFGKAVGKASPIDSISCPVQNSRGEAFFLECTPTRIKSVAFLGLMKRFESNIDKVMRQDGFWDGPQFANGKICFVTKASLEALLEHTARLKVARPYIMYISPKFSLKSIPPSA